MHCARPRKLCSADLAQAETDHDLGSALFPKCDRIALVFVHAWKTNTLMGGPFG